jgi:hypothetical protein
MNKIKILLLILLTAVLISPVFVRAATIEELTALINSLKAQLQQLESQLSQAQQGTTAWCHDFNVNLKMGDSGYEVSNLYSALFKNGLVEERSSNFTNNFDEYVASAVSGFQEKYRDEILTPVGLKHGTGFVGKLTRAKLNKLYGCGGNAIPNPAPTPKPVACVKEGESLGAVVPGNNLQCCAGLEQYIEPGLVGSRGICVKATSTPPITVLSPNGGESWKVGETHTITWNSQNLSANARIQIGFGTGEGIITSSALNTGSYSWTIPQTIGSGNNYKINVYALDNGIGDWSDAPFSIVAAGTNSGVSVISPNGGESWKVGETRAITWDGPSPKSSLPTIIKLIDTRPTANILPSEAVIFRSTDNSGVYNWTIPQSLGTMNLGAGNVYKIKIEDNGGGALLFTDSSDAPFSIVAISSQPKILSFTASDPKLYSNRAVTLSWLASAPTDAVIEFICPSGLIQFYIKEDGRIVGCDKGGLVNYTNQTNNLIFIQPQGNSVATPITFNLVLLKNGVPTEEKRSVTVVFPATSACVLEGGSLGAVVPGNTVQCCSGLIPYIEPGLVGSRGVCTKVTSAASPTQQLASILESVNSLMAQFAEFLKNR